MQNEFFAVIPDNQETPAALFVDLEDALDWAVDRFGMESFRIRLHLAFPMQSTRFIH